MKFHADRTERLARSTRLLGCFLTLAFASVAAAQDAPLPPEVVEFDVLDKLVTPQWIRTDAEGTLQGRVDVPLTGGLRRADLARIALIPINGPEDATTLRSKTTLEGTFSIENVPYGTYGLVVHSSDVLATYCVHVLPASRLSGSNAKANPIRKASMQPAAVSADDLRVYAAPTNSTYVMQRVRSYIPMEPASPYDVHRFAADPLPNRSTAGERRVYANPDGSLKGRIVLPVGDDGKSPPLRNMNVIIVQGEKAVATKALGADGRFTIPELPPGDYGLVAAGGSGFGSVGFEFLGQRTAQLNNGTTRYVSMQPPGDDVELRLEIVPSFVMNEVEAEFQRDDQSDTDEIGPPVKLDEFGWPVDPNAAPGAGQGAGAGQSAASSGSGGGGGGGGGGSGGGGLAGLTSALGLGAAALAAGNGNNNGASPAIP